MAIFFPLDPEHAMFVEIGTRPLVKNTRLSEELTISFIKLVFENAHRFVFSKESIENIPSIRKRVVDEHLYEKEKQNINSWHQKNLELEKEYPSNSF